MATLSNEDRTIYDASFFKTINSHFGGDEAAYNAMLATVATLKAGRPLLNVQRQPTTELVPLVLMVRANIPDFTTTMKAIVKQVTAKRTTAAAAAAGGAAGPGASSVPPFTLKFRHDFETKAPYRIIEKSLTKGPRKQRLDVSKVFDVFGCIIVCVDYKATSEVIHAFADKHNAGELDMSRVKDRWTAPSGGGWRDFMLNVVINGVVFEVQVVLDSMLVARTALDAHKAYNQFRCFAEVFGMLGLSTSISVGGGGGSSRNTSPNSGTSISGGGDGGGGGGGSARAAQEVAQLKQRLEVSEAARVAAEEALDAERSERAAAAKVASVARPDTPSAPVSPAPTHGLLLIMPAQTPGAAMRDDAVTLIELPSQLSKDDAVLTMGRGQAASTDAIQVPYIATNTEAGAGAGAGAAAGGSTNGPTTMLSRKHCEISWSHCSGGSGSAGSTDAEGGEGGGQHRAGSGAAEAARTQTSAPPGWYVRDCGTQNGTHVDGVRLEGGQRRLLADGSLLVLGSTKAVNGYVPQFRWLVKHTVLPATTRTDVDGKGAEAGGKERRDKDAVLPSAKRARIKTDETPC